MRCVVYNDAIKYHAIVYYGKREDLARLNKSEASESAYSLWKKYRNKGASTDAIASNWIA